MNLLDQVAEARIREAQSQGEFDNLVGSGQPLQLDADELVEPSLRVAYRILKNSGFVPAEVLQRQQIGNLEALLQQVADPAKRKPLIAELLKQLAQLDTTCCADSRAQYFNKLLDRLGGSEPALDAKPVISNPSI